MISDEALMLDFQHGSRPAFEELFTRYREPLSGFFRRRLTNRERAEDLTQETFVAAADEVLWVREASQKLEPSEREILMLREYEQLSYPVPCFSDSVTPRLKATKPQFRVLRQRFHFC